MGGYPFHNTTTTAATAFNTNDSSDHNNTHRSYSTFSNSIMKCFTWETHGGKQPQGENQQAEADIVFCINLQFESVHIQIKGHFCMK